MRRVAASIGSGSPASATGRARPRASRIPLARQTSLRLPSMLWWILPNSRGMLDPLGNLASFGKFAPARSVAVTRHVTDAAARPLGLRHPRHPLLDRSPTRSPARSRCRSYPDLDHLQAGRRRPACAAATSTAAPRAPTRHDPHSALGGAVAALEGGEARGLAFASGLAADGHPARASRAAAGR